MQRAQEMLGKLHDLQVLQTHVAAVQAEPPSGRMQPRAALDDLARHIEGQCRHLHGRYVAAAPSLREATVAIRKTIVPQLAQTPRRGRPLKMSLASASPTRKIARAPHARAIAGGR
jgi:hypothetical protein